jgi:hypothetical protein
VCLPSSRLCFTVLLVVEWCISTDSAVVARATIPGAARSGDDASRDLFLTACKDGGEGWEGAVVDDHTSDWVTEVSRRHLLA